MDTQSNLKKYIVTSIALSLFLLQIPQSSPCAEPQEDILQNSGSQSQSLISERIPSAQPRIIIVKFDRHSLVATVAQEVFDTRQKFADFFSPSLDDLFDRYHVVRVKRITRDPLTFEKVNIAGYKFTREVPGFSGALDNLYEFEIGATDMDLKQISRAFARDKNIRSARVLNSSPFASHIAKEAAPEPSSAKLINAQAVKSERAAAKAAKKEKILAQKIKQIEAKKAFKEEARDLKLKEQEARANEKRQQEEVRRQARLAEKQAKRQARENAAAQKHQTVNDKAAEMVRQKSDIVNSSLDTYTGASSGDN